MIVHRARRFFHLIEKRIQLLPFVVGQGGSIEWRGVLSKDVAGRANRSFLRSFVSLASLPVRFDGANPVER